jgi:proteasome assembly chaperone (PAC2) family protein
VLWFRYNDHGRITGLGINITKEPALDKPVLVAAWPGIGNVGVLAADTLRGQLQAEEFAELEPWEYFYPKKVTIKNGLLQDLEFPASKFYFKKLAACDLIIFLGEDQPGGGARPYAEGRKAYAMANMVLDLGAQYGCRRVYTSGAAVGLTHHTMKPRVWVVGSTKELNQEVRGHANTVLMREIEGRDEQGSITGLNGLLLGVAKKRGFEAACLMGEVPDYLAGAPFPYPRASRAVLEVLSSLIGARVDYTGLDGIIGQVDSIVNGLYEKLPPEMRERVEQRKQPAPLKNEGISEEEEKWMKEHIDELFREKGGSDERSS